MAVPFLVLRRARSDRRRSDRRNRSGGNSLHPVTGVGQPDCV